MRLLIRRIAEHPLSALMVVAAVMIFGAVAFFQLRRELLPGLSVPVARVVCEYPAMPASQIEELVTIPLENALSSVRGVREISSVSKEEIGAVSLRFDWKADMRTAAVDIRQRIDALYPFLPYGAGKPVVFLEDANDQPLLTLAVTLASDLAAAQAPALVRGEIATALRQIPGVAAVQVVGLSEPEIHVEADEQRLAVAGLSLQGLAAGVAGSLCDHPVGIIREGERERLLKASTGVRSVEALASLPIVAHAAPPSLRLADFATVRLGSRQRTSYFHLDGRPCVGLLLYKSPEAGSLNVARRVHRRLAALQARLGAQASIAVVADSSREIRSATRDLLAAMALGVLATFAVLGLLLRGALPALIVAAALPVAVLSVFLVMGLADISLNVISLAGMAAGVGMIVDGGIVVLDRLVQRRASDPEQIADAAASAAGALTGSTATTVLVFLPVLFIPGVTGALFRELVLTVSFLLLASLLTALLLTPALYSLFSRRLTAGQAVAAVSQRLLRRCLVFCFRRPAVPLVLTGAVLASAIAAAWTLPRELLPRVGEQRLELTVRFAPATAVAEAERASREIASRLRQLPGMSGVFAAAGYDQASLAERGLPDGGPLTVRCQLLLTAGGGRGVAPVTEAIAALLHASLGVRWTLNVPQDSLTRLLGGDAEPGLRLEGQDRELLIEAATRIAGELAELSGGRSRAHLDTLPEDRQVVLALDPEALRHHGLQAAEVLAALRLAVRGQIVGTLPVGAERLGVRVSLRALPDQAEKHLAGLRVPAPAGPVELGLLGALERRAVYPELRRHDRRPCVSLHFEGLEAAAESARRLRERAGAEAALLGASALHEVRGEIIGVFAFALVLICLLLAAQFESLLVALQILACLPVSAAGSLLLLRACGCSLNLSSLLGILILTGTAVNTPILLASAGRSRTPGAVIAAAAGHLRPAGAAILTTAVALLPLALMGRGGSALQSQMAVALIGGLIGTGVSALLLFPLLYARRRS